MNGQKLKLRPWVRGLGLVLLLVLALVCYLSARAGDVEILATSLVMFFVVAPVVAPVVIVGRLPGGSLIFSKGDQGFLNEDPFKIEDDDERKAFIFAFIVSFIVAALSVVASFSG